MARSVCRLRPTIPRTKRGPRLDLGRTGGPMVGRAKALSIDSITVDPLLVRHVGRVSGVIDACMDGRDELASHRPFYGDGDRLAAGQSEARAMGKRRSGRRTGHPLNVAERAALGGPISRTNVSRAWRRFGRVTQPSADVPLISASGRSHGRMPGTPRRAAAIRSKKRRKRSR